jgi:hypothetical protein
MKMTRERKIYGALLCLGIAALGADKLFFSPAEAPAASLLIQSSGPKPVIAHNKPVVSPPAEPQTKDQPLMGLGVLADRMRGMAEAERLDLADARDAFRPPVAWVGNIAIPTQTQQQPGLGAGDAFAAFHEKHHLIAVLKSSKGGMAILDGKSVRPGQTVDGFKLLRVGESSAVFESNGKTVEMQLPVNAQLDPQSITPAGR